MDLNEEFIKKCRKSIPSANSSKISIFEANLDKKNNIWLFINSLYCLSNVDQLMEHLSPSMDYIIGVFPFIDHMNYKMYFRKNPDTDRPSEMDKATTLDFFRQYGYEMIAESRKTSIPYYALSIPVLNTFKSRFLNLIDPLMSDQNGAYWIALFKKVSR